MQGLWQHFVPKRTRRWLVVRKLRSQLKVESFRRGFARFYAIECSAEELAEIESITEEEIDSIGEFLRELLGVRGRIPEISILCFGRDTPMEKVPMLLRGLLKEFFGGCWITELWAVLLGFGERCPIRRIVRHELTHGLLDILTGGFQYSMAIQEGFAGFVEHQPGHDADLQHGAPQGSLQGPPRYWEEADVLTIKEILAYRYELPLKPNYTQRAYMCYWLVAYLVKISERQPEFLRILEVIWKRNLKESEAVYAWLEETSGLTLDELEDGFRRFCMGERTN